MRSRQTRGWQFDKTISLSSVLGALVLILPFFIFQAEVDKRIAGNEQRINHIEAMQVRNREEFRQSDMDIKNTLNKINNKLDRLIEGKNRHE